MSWDGKVTENFADRLQQAARNGTGYLEVHDSARERRGWVFLEDQHVVAVLVDGYQPRLARRLTASEFVSVADMGEVLAVTRDEYDPRIAVECVARGLVDAVTMQVLYREFMLSAASFVDEWQLGDSQWVADVPPWEGRSTAVSVPLLVTAMVRRKAHWGNLWTELSTVTIPDRVPVRTGPVDYRPKSPDEAAVLGVVNGKRTVDQVAGECGFTRFQTGHLIAALIAKKVLDLFPVNGPPSTSKLIRVQAGYYAACEPVPDLAVPVVDVSAGGGPHDELPPRRSWGVPLTMRVPLPPETGSDPMHETTQDPVTDPVAADDPERNVVTQQVEVEDARGVLGSGHTSGDIGPVVTEGPCGGPGEPPSIVREEEKVEAEVEAEVAETDESVEDVGREAEVDPGTPHWAEPAEGSQPAANLGDFFVGTAPLPPAVPEQPPAVAVVQKHALPPLPAITGGPSEFYAVPPSALPRRPGGLVVRALTGLPVAEQPAGHTARHAAKREPAGLDPATAVETARAEQKAELDPAREAIAGWDVEGDLEVTRLRDELLRLAAARRAANDQAAMLHEEVLLHSASADASAVLVEEAGRSIARLTLVTSEASATADSQLEGLESARDEDERVATLRAQIDEDAEKARKALVLGQREYDEASAAHASLTGDLQAEMAARETVLEAWTSATQDAVHSAAKARHAEEAAAECDQLIKEARERLTQMATADQ